MPTRRNIIASNLLFFQRNGGSDGAEHHGQPDARPQQVINPAPTPPCAPYGGTKPPPGAPRRLNEVAKYVEGQVAPQLQNMAQEYGLVGKAASEDPYAKPAIERGRSDC